jgi:hypothetical protein
MPTLTGAVSRDEGSPAASGLCDKLEIERETDEVGPRFCNSKINWSAV